MPDQTSEKEEVDCEKLSRKLRYCKILLKDNNVGSESFGPPGHNFCCKLIETFDRKCPRFNKVNNYEISIRDYMKDMDSVI